MLYSYASFAIAHIFACFDAALAVAAALARRHCDAFKTYADALRLRC